MLTDTWENNQTRFKKSDWLLTNIEQHISPYFKAYIIYCIWKPMLSIYQQAIKFGCLFLAIFKVFTD